MAPEQFEQQAALAKSFGGVVRDGKLTFEHRWDRDGRALWLSATGAAGKLYGWTLWEQHLTKKMADHEAAYRESTRHLREELRKARRNVTKFDKEIQQ